MPQSTANHLIERTWRCCAKSKTGATAGTSRAVTAVQRDTSRQQQLLIPQQAPCSSSSYTMHQQQRVTRARRRLLRVSRCAPVLVLVHPCPRSPTCSRHPPPHTPQRTSSSSSSSSSSQCARSKAQRMMAVTAAVGLQRDSSSSTISPINPRILLRS